MPRSLLGPVLAVLVPAFTLLVLEGLCRALSLETWLSSESQTITLEMPTWLERDRNSQFRMARLKSDHATVDWMSMFESGDGYRVRLIPHSNKVVTNTFSQLTPRPRYRVQANSLGFRSPEPDGFATDSDLRIMIFGDSSSFGWGVEQDEMYSSKLSEILSQRLGNKSAKVINFAIPGDSSEYGRLLVKRFLPEYAADLVIFGFGANDAKPVFVPHTAQVESFEAHAKLHSLRYWVSKSSLFRSLEAAVSNISRVDSTPGELPTRSAAVPLRRYLQNLSSMAKHAHKRHSAKSLFLNLCTPGNYAKRARRIAERDGHLYLNGQAYLKRQIPLLESGALKPAQIEAMKKEYGAQLERNQIFLISDDACHPNAVGHELIAEELARIIAAHILS